MSEQDGNDNLVPLPPIEKSESLCLHTGNSQIEETKPEALDYNHIEPEDFGLDELKDATNVPSKNITINTIEIYSPPMEKANKSFQDNAKCSDFSKITNKTSMPNEISKKSLAQSSFVYKPFDYTLHGMTDFEHLIDSERNKSSEATDPALSFEKQKEAVEVPTKNSTITAIRAQSFNNKKSIKRLDCSQIDEQDDTLGEEADPIDMFCSTMRNPEELVSMFAADESEISIQDTQEPIDSQEEINYQESMKNAINNQEEFKKSNDRHNESSDLKIGKGICVSHDSLKIAGNVPPIQNSQNDLEESGKGVDTGKHIDTLLKNKTSRLLESSQLSDDKVADVQVFKHIYNDTLESGEIFEDASLEAQQDQIRHEHRASDLEDGEVAGDDNSPSDLPDFLNKKEIKSKLLESGEWSGENTLEDGEISDEDDYEPRDLPQSEESCMPICRFHIRNACSWGNKCRFRHPEPSNKGNYVMFEKKFLPEAPHSNLPAWPALITTSVDAHAHGAKNLNRGPRSSGLNDLDTDPYYSKDQSEASERFALLPTPTFDELLMSQKNYQKRSFRSTARTSKLRPIAWESRLSSSSPSMTWRESHSDSSSPEGSPRRRGRHIRSTIRTTTTPSLPCRHSLKRHRTASLSRSSACKIRGPRTPSCSPPRRSSIVARPEPKRQRPSKSTISSSESSESSSYESTTESSDEVSSSSESDSRGTSSRRTGITSQTALGASAKKASRNSEKLSSRAQTSSSKNQEISTPQRRSRSSTSKSHTQTYSKSSTNTPARNPLKVIPNAPKKHHSAVDNSYSVKKKQSRQEYLLLQLLRVEAQIAKKKKQRMKALKRS
ncbi:zinc finger CCCH domain-containing protein 18 [Drosophila elegans]|uniref:zinc finger CCCH domain-containing protein 18 n=1 Tax=Drosophila elegans TaxID=30023 RepID=UPI001BC83B2A|nr:zinc finger CCCH domain-containing protein 18 [Drosophila elegans]